ncbi:MAG: ribonuclease HI [Clostridiales bacterium]|nr:ribonuclease HI [Clostridiales bacterium]
MKTVDIYTDGACSGNPGPGGTGTILIFNGVNKEISKGYTLTTNNRMEIMAVIDGLNALKEECNVNLYSDSKYVVDAVSKGWVYNWKKNGWLRNKKEPALNTDLWEKLLPLLDTHNVQFIWVKGHSTNPLNNRCDELARNAINTSEKLEDFGYFNK